MESMFRIKELRKAQNLSQQALAEKIGYKSGAAITMWETGARNPPSRILPQLAAVFQCAVEDLFVSADTQNSA